MLLAGFVAGFINYTFYIFKLCITKKFSKEIFNSNCLKTYVVAGFIWKCFSLKKVMVCQFFIAMQKDRLCEQVGRLETDYGWSVGCLVFGTCSYREIDDVACKIGEICDLNSKEYLDRSGQLIRWLICFGLYILWVSPIPIDSIMGILLATSKDSSKRKQFWESELLYLSYSPNSKHQNHKPLSGSLVRFI